MSDIESVRVALRVRPLVQLERDRGCQEAVEKVATAQVVVNRTDSFTFNHVFDASDTQERVYNESVSEMLDSLFGGFNATILAYGQTGSGKTHTMGTAFDGELNEDVGVIPRAMDDIFKRIRDLSDVCDFEVTCSFMELYQEQVFDLLSSKSREESVIDMRENKNGIIMPGLTEQVVSTARETTDCLVRGSTGRAVASTAMNKQSSRSHAIFTVTINATKKDEMKTVTTSKFHLVDLAGSERSKKTQATGDRFKEGVKINQGLLALGNVISSLGSGQGSGFVRYRDSKLTRLLQDSLGGNSVTLMIACVSPADYNVAETLSTLRYADRARKIKNKPIVNQDPHAAEINHLKDVIQQLRLQLISAGGGMTSSLTSAVQNVIAVNNTDSHLMGNQHQVKNKAYQQLQEKYHNLQHQLQTTLHDLAENEMREHILEAAHEKLKSKMDGIRGVVSVLASDFQIDAAPDKLEQHMQSMQELNKLCQDMDEEFERTHQEIRHCKHSYMNANGENLEDESGPASADVTLEVHALMQEQTDVYNSKQIDFKDQLRRINHELNLKVELHQRVAGNLTKFHTLDDNITEKVKECESKIHDLEAERSELLDKLKHMKDNVSAKLAEERRKRVHTLEQEINEIKRKNMQQAKLLKVREKEAQKIINLHSEIQVMKESKVKLIRAMRQESENFRQWKLTREKELLQLRNKDRKMQNEMTRKEILHTKQRNVLKRKCEEAMAINKRLKDAMDRQKVAQSQRQKIQSTKGANVTAVPKIEHVISWVEREVEVIISLIDAEQSLEQLMEDRSIISSRITELQKQVESCAASVATKVEQELTLLQEEYKMRNAQITDLQQKVCAADLETRMRSLGDNIQSLIEARAVLMHLLKTISEMRREYASGTVEHKTLLDDQNAMREAAEERCNTAAKKMRLMELEHEEAIAERENYYEEKISLLLHEINNVPHLVASAVITPQQEELLKIQEEQLNKMDAMRDKLEEYKNLVTKLQSAPNPMTEGPNKNVAKAPPTKVEYKEEIFISSDDDFEEDDNDGNDPDWKKTPLFRRRYRRNKYSNERSSSNMDDTYTTATSTAAVRTSETSSVSSVNGGEPRNIRKGKGCACRSNCHNKRCGCHSLDEKCSKSCRCSKDCVNGKNEHAKESTPENDDNATAVENERTSVGSEINGSNDIVANTFADKNMESDFKTAILTSKVARMSTLSFDKASKKKRFFD